MAEPCPVVYGHIVRGATHRALKETSDLVTVLVDTGAEETVIDIGLAEKLGLPETDPDVPAYLISVDGKRVPSRQFTCTIEVPDWHRSFAATFLAIDLSNDECDAILGMDFFHLFTLIVHGPTGRVGLLDLVSSPPLRPESDEDKLLMETLARFGYDIREALTRLGYDPSDLL